MTVKYVVKVKVGNTWKFQESFDDIESAKIINRVNASNGIKSKVVRLDQSKIYVRIIELSLFATIAFFIIMGIASGCFISVITSPDVIGVFMQVAALIVVFGVDALTYGK